MRLKYSVILLTAFLISGCATREERLYRKLSHADPNHIHYKGHYKIGKEYAANCQVYTPEKDEKYVKVGIASWYGTKHGFHGRKTANGDRYNKETLTAAHQTLPMPSLAKVTNLANNKSLIVMINDRGPFTNDPERILDVSERVAKILSFKRQGTTKVKIEYMRSETQDFLKTIALNAQNGAKAKRRSTKTNNHCSINCHVQLVNLKHNLPISE